MSATYDLTRQSDTELMAGDPAVEKAQFLGTVSFPEHENHDPEGEPVEDQLTFEVNIYLPTDGWENAAQAYADDYESGYWEAVADHGKVN